MNAASTKRHDCCRPPKIGNREDVPVSASGEHCKSHSFHALSPEWICYCFEISQKMIREKTQKTGKMHYSEWIRQEIAAERCDCEAKNPSGHCCLGQVLAIEKNAFKT